MRALRLRHLVVSTGFGFAHALALAGGFWYVAHQAGAGRLAVGDVAVYVNAVVQLEAGLFGLSMSLGMGFELGSTCGSCSRSPTMRHRASRCRLRALG